MQKEAGEYAAGLAALDSIFQVFAYSFYAWIFITVLPPCFGFEGAIVTISMSTIAEGVAIYLGIPLEMGIVRRWILVKQKDWVCYNQKFIPAMFPLALLALLFTIVIMFSLTGALIVKILMAVLIIAVALMLYFILMFFTSFLVTKALCAEYDKNSISNYYENRK